MKENWEILQKIGQRLTGRMEDYSGISGDGFNLSSRAENLAGFAGRFDPEQ